MTGRFALVDRLAQEAFGQRPRWRFFVPGRLEVFGKHTDYAGGRTLVAAVPRGFAVAVLPADDGAVVVIDAVKGAREAFALADVDRSAASWQRYVIATIRRLAANFPGANLSARIVFASDLPHASGISSSSALVISMAHALITRAELETTDTWRSAIRTAEDRAAYFGCIENGASFGSLAGDTGVGTHGGSEDHAAILTSVAGHLQQFAFCPLRLDRRVRMPDGWTFAVASSGVRASKTGAARARYNRLSADTVAIVEAWRAAHPDDTRTLGELVADGSIARLPLPRPLAERLEHFAAEDARVPRAADAFARGDVEAIGGLADASQRDAGRLLRNQVPETIDLVSMARDTGAAAASAFGAGWGGSVWALVRASAADEFVERWLRAYRGRYPHWKAEGFVAPPADGLRMEGD